jgi:molecular chaperone DnaK
LADLSAAQIKSKTEALAQASMKLGEAIYKAQQEGGDAQAGAASGAGPGQAAGSDKVVDADFEEVNDSDKKSKSA